VWRGWVVRTRCHKATAPIQGRVHLPILSGKDYFSASQLENFNDCPRKWAWRYLEGIDAPSNQYAVFGLAVHGQIERYLKTGTPFDLTTDEGEAAMAGIHYLPQPGTEGMTVEGQFVLTGWGHKFLGYKDVQVNRIVGSGPLPGRAPITDQIDPNKGKMIPLVIDHKTTGNFKWAKTADELKKNIQAVVYATHAMVGTGAEACDLRWIYYKRSRPFQAKAVDVRVTRGDLESPLIDIKGLADSMAGIKNSGYRALDLPPNPGACGSYGGCPYVRHCDLSPTEKVFALMSQADLDARKNAFLQGLKIA
jgi:RecB family exonuclease